MKTLILFGSPRKNGNTDRLLRCFMDSLPGEKYVISAYEQNIKPCTDCRYCYNEKKCAIQDDMSKIYDLIENCDNIIIASPMYFAALPSPLKAIIDRLQVYWSSKYIRKEENIMLKRGAVIITAGTKWDNMFAGVEETLKYVFKMINAKKVCSIYAADTDKSPVSDNNELLKYCKECSEKFRAAYTDELP